MKHAKCLGLLITWGATMVGCEANQAPPPPPKPAVVKVSLPVKDTVRDFEDFTGRTDAILSVEVRARVTGYLDKVHFSDGTEVEEGAPLFEIDPRPYKAELERYEANVNQADAHMKRFEADQR